MERLGEPVAAGSGRRGVCDDATRARRRLRKRRAFACSMDISVCRADQMEARAAAARRAGQALATARPSALVRALVNLPATTDACLTVRRPRWRAQPREA